MLAQGSLCSQADQVGLSNEKYSHKPTHVKNHIESSIPLYIRKQRQTMNIIRKAFTPYDSNRKKALNNKKS